MFSVIQITICVHSYQLNDDVISFLKAVIDSVVPTHLSSWPSYFADEQPVGTERNFPRYHPIHMIHLYV